MASRVTVVVITLLILFTISTPVKAGCDCDRATSGMTTDEGSIVGTEKPIP